jgi:hypothetical protein
MGFRAYPSPPESSNNLASWNENSSHVVAKGLTDTYNSLICVFLDDSDNTRTPSIASSCVQYQWFRVSKCCEWFIFKLIDYQTKLECPHGGLLWHNWVEFVKIAECLLEWVVEKKTRSLSNFFFFCDKQNSHKW